MACVQRLAEWLLNYDLRVGVLCQVLCAQHLHPAESRSFLVAISASDPGGSFPRYTNFAKAFDQHTAFVFELSPSVRTSGPSLPVWLQDGSSKQITWCNKVQAHLPSAQVQAALPKPCVQEDSEGPCVGCTPLQKQVPLWQFSPYNIGA